MSTRGFSIPLDMGASIAGMIGKTGNNTAGEDSPSAPTPARIVDIRNVMPTELGYFSAYGPIKVNTDRQYELQPHEFKYTEFEEDELNRPLAALKKARIQHVIPYETASGVRVYIILAETGIFVRNNMAALGEEIEEPEKVVGPADVVEVLIPDEGIFNLWTYAFLDGSLYCYLQNREEVYIFGDLGIHLSLDTLEVEYRKIREWESDILQVVAAKPSFLNMEGQIGIFRAGNRLGFWDSDNAIAWSSAFNKMDFTPDVVSLAGVTKFTAMTGGIVAIISTTRGFIIYCSSCVLVASPTGSEEQWSADVVLAETGIDYYFQATSGSNPEQHFAWTKSGLYRILNGRAEAILEDDFRALKAQSGYDNEMLYRLTAIDDTYLVISRAPIWHERPAKSDFVIGNIKGEKGDYPFYIPSVKVPTPELGVGWQDVLEGRYPGLENPNLDDDWILEDPDMPSLDEGKPLIPFFTGYAYQTPTNFHLLSTPWSDVTIPIPEFQSTLFPEITIKRADGYYYPADTGVITDPCKDKAPNPIPTEVRHRKMTSSYEWNARLNGFWGGSNKFIDKAGQEFYDLFQSSLQQYAEDITYLWGHVGGSEGIGALERLYDDYSQCSALRESIDNLYIYGWQMQGVDLAMSYPGEFSDIPWPTLTPPEVETPSSWYDPTNGYTEELHEYYKHFFQPESPVPGTSMVKYHENNVAAKVPFPQVPLHVEVDSCSLKVWAFADTVNFTRIMWLEPMIYAEGRRRKPLPGIWGLYEEDDPVPNSPMDIYRSPAGSETWAFAHGIRWEFPYALYPSSFLNKDWETIKEMLDPANRSKYPELWVAIFEAEVSGLGYADRVSSSWTRYIKTISRARLWLTNPEGECNPPFPAQKIREEGDFEFEEVILDQNEGGEFDDYLWPWSKYPENLNENSGYPDPPEWTWPIDMSYGATYRKGTRMPYYPIYDKAWVLDLPLAKWGSLDWPHSLVFSTHPAGGMGASIIPSEDYSTGRPSPIKQFDTRGTVDSIMPFGIVPKFVVPRQAYWEDPYSWYSVKEELYDTPMVTYPSEILMQHGLPTLLNRGGTGGRLTVEATSLTRDGFTKMVGLSGDGVTHATIQVLASFHGGAFGTVMPLAITPNYPMYLSNQQSYVGTFNLEPAGLGSKMYQDFRAPFVLVGKEFQITVAGHFALQKLICYGQPTGGVRFFPTEYTGW